jgi:3-methylcrotonyl-CoA carboxylase alpha subunit
MEIREIRKLLIANRGEIALRIQRTCRAMGIATVAVFSDADEDALFVRRADEAVRIGPAPSRESYLVIEKIVDAARRTGADAIHPGYGFLSERAELAEACEAAGIVFVGPTPAAIRAMGLKREAKRTAAEAGVPVVPGYDGASQDDDELYARALEVGFPLLLKASAGGGGKGMRLVHEEAALRGAIESARREALSAFGDGTLIVERYVQGPRHVEIQILGDRHGNLVHLFERECSIQRRHQKIVEESPSPAISPDLRARMGQAAIAVGRAIGYSSAGTVEFVLGDDGAFYFLEVNTRLQVEHPVTEMVTGIDLVAEQIRVARGERLSFTQEDLRLSGHALEVRLYAEDPANHFLPSTGRLVDFHVPTEEGVRLDTGVETGDEVSMHYDPMVAKIIAHGRTRDEARRRLVRTLERASVMGVTTNRAFLARVLEHPAFAAGSLSTHFIAEHLQDALAEPADAERDRLAVVAAALVGHTERAAGRVVLPALPAGYRNNRFGPERVTFEVGGATVEVSYTPARGPGMAGRRRAFDVVVGEGAPRRYTLVSWHAPVLTLEDDAGAVHRFRVIVGEGGARFWVHGPRGSVALRELPRFPERGAAKEKGSCNAPMPGKVVRVAVAEGEVVEAGAVLVVLEAMKMEHSVRAPEAGRVTRLAVREGDQVDGGAILAVVTPT